MTEQRGLRPEGVLMELGANKPFAPTRPESVWLVREGQVDVFARAGTGGRNRHVVRVERGQAIFGISLNGFQERISLIAVGGPGTNVIEFPLSFLQELPNFPADFKDPVTLVENWVTSLSRSVRWENPQRGAVELQAKAEVAVPCGVDVLCRNGVLWVRPARGDVQFLGRAELPPLSPASYYPLSDRMWIRCASEANVHVMDTVNMFGQGRLYDSLSAFHSLVMSCLLADLVMEEKQDRDLFERRAEADQLSMMRTVSDLAAVLDKKGVAPASMEAGDNLLLRACRMVAERVNIQVAPAHLISKSASTFADPLASIAKASRFRTRKVLLKGAWWREDSGPLLAYLEDGNVPVALLPQAAGKYTLYNPSNHSSTPVTPENAASLTGTAYIFYRPFPDMKLGARELLRFGLLGTGKDIGFVVLMGIGIGLIGLMLPIITGEVYGSVIPTANRGQLFQLTLALVIGAVAVAVFQVTQSIAVLRIEGKMDFAVQAGLWDRLLNLPVPFFRNYTTGELASRATGLDMIRQILSTNMVSAVLGSMFSLFNFGLLYYYDWQLALLGTILVLLAVVVTSLSGYYQVRHQRPLLLLQSKIAGMVFQFISGIAKLRVAAAEPRAYAAWARQFAQQKKHSVDARNVANWQATFDAAFPVISSLCIFAWVGLVAQATLPTGKFLSFYAAFVGFLAGMLQFNRSIVSSMTALPIFDMCRSILEELPEMDATRADPGELNGAIEVSHVVFRYAPDSPLVLRDVSIKATPGEFIAICGASGCGKSTLFRLLLNFEEPESGAIYYDGMDVAALDPRAVRRQVGVVLQSSQLLPGDIFSNIVGSSILTQEDAWEAARMAGFDKDLEQMPMGMFTVVSEGGGNLSGGQRQRLMIARAIVRKPRVLLFDEATSALDNQTQSIVSEALDKLQATRIVIAHRLSTIQNATRIYVMDAGSVVQVGNYHELLQQQGVFAELARRQLL